MLGRGEGKLLEAPCDIAGADVGAVTIIPLRIDWAVRNEGSVGVKAVEGLFKFVELSDQAERFGSSFLI
jgi:hypothetical protein